MSGKKLSNPDLSISKGTKDFFSRTQNEQFAKIYIHRVRENKFMSAMGLRLNVCSKYFVKKKKMEKNNCKIDFSPSFFMTLIWKVGLTHSQSFMLSALSIYVLHTFPPSTTTSSWNLFITIFREEKTDNKHTHSHRHIHTPHGLVLRDTTTTKRTKTMRKLSHTTNQSKKHALNCSSSPIKFLRFYIEFIRKHTTKY